MLFRNLDRLTRLAQISDRSETNSERLKNIFFLENRKRAFRGASFRAFIFH